MAISLLEGGNNMPSISEMFTQITAGITAFTQALAQAFSGITALFYTPGEGSAAGSWTFLGVLLLVVVSVGIVYLCYRVISSLIRRV